MLIHTPVHASWLNRVEVYYSIIQRKALTPNDFASLEEVEQRLLLNEELTNRDPHPFDWEINRAALRAFLTKRAFDQWIDRIDCGVSGVPYIQLRNGPPRVDSLALRTIGIQGSSVVLASTSFLAVMLAFFEKRPDLPEVPYFGGSFPTVGWGVVRFESPQPTSDSVRKQVRERRKKFFIALAYP